MAVIGNAAGLDATSHVFVILMENHNWVDIKGSPNAPYVNNTLLPMASYCDQYYNPPALHPSEPVTDSWRQFYGVSDDTADNDGDGLANGQEYFAGTNPNDAQSNLSAPSVTAQPGGGFLVSWPSRTGIVYRLQWKNALSDPTWQSITPDFVGTGSTQSWQDDGSQTGGLPADARFYRVTVP